MRARLSVVVVGCGNMGSSHAKAYHSDPGFELVGVVDRVPGPRRALAAALGGVAEIDVQFVSRLDAVLVTSVFENSEHQCGLTYSAWSLVW